MANILIIEDEIAIAELEKDYLELAGFQVEMVHDGKKGLAEALNGDYQLIILDLMLPVLDGFEICKQVREKKDIPILMVSAKKEDIDKIRGLGLGADDYMTKPFSPSELVARVKAHLARYDRLVRNHGRENEIIEIRGMKIDKTARRVYVNEEEKLAELYSVADVMVVPSLQEVFGYTVCEAMACGTPVVAFSVGGILDQIEHKKNGYLAECRNVKSLAEGIEYCAQNTEELGKNAHRSAQRFSQEFVGEKYKEYFEKILQNR